MMIFFPYYQLFFVISFVNGATIINKVFITYAHFVENLGSTRSTKVTSLLFFTDSTILIWSPLFLMTVSKNAMVLVYVALAMCIALGILIITRGLQESIKFLLLQGRYSEAIMQINKTNSVNKASIES